MPVHESQVLPGARLRWRGGHHPGQEFDVISTSENHVYARLPRGSASGKESRRTKTSFALDRVLALCDLVRSPRSHSRLPMMIQEFSIWKESDTNQDQRDELEYPFDVLHNNGVSVEEFSQIWLDEGMNILEVAQYVGVYQPGNSNSVTTLTDIAMALSLPITRPKRKSNNSLSTPRYLPELIAELQNKSVTPEQFQTAIKAWGISSLTRRINLHSDFGHWNDGNIRSIVAAWNLSLPGGSNVKPTGIIPEGFTFGNIAISDFNDVKERKSATSRPGLVQPKIFHPANMDMMDPYEMLRRQRAHIHAEIEDKRKSVADLTNKEIALDKAIDTLRQSGVFKISV